MQFEEKPSFLQSPSAVPISTWYLRALFRVLKVSFTAVYFYQRTFRFTDERLVDAISQTSEGYGSKREVRLQQTGIVSFPLDVILQILLYPGPRRIFLFLIWLALSAPLSLIQFIFFSLCSIRPPIEEKVCCWDSFLWPQDAFTTRARGHGTVTDLADVWDIQRRSALAWGSWHFCSSCSEALYIRILTRSFSVYADRLHVIGSSNVWTNAKNRGGQPTDHFLVAKLFTWTSAPLQTHSSLMVSWRSLWEHLCYEVQLAS